MRVGVGAEAAARASRAGDTTESTRLKNAIILREILRTENVLSGYPAIRTGYGIAKGRLFQWPSLDLIETSLAKGVAAAENTRHLMNFIVLKATNRALFLLH